MAASFHVYPANVLKALSKLENIASGGDTLKAFLLSSYTPGSPSTHATMTDVKAAGTEASGTGYTAGGQTLAGQALSLSGFVVTWTGTSPVWHAAGGALAAAFMVIYDSAGGTDATNLPILYWDFGGTITATNADFTAQISGSGLLTATTN